jgi:hypothetical protein
MDKNYDIPCLPTALDVSVQDIPLERLVQFGPRAAVRLGSHIRLCRLRIQIRILPERDQRVSRNTCILRYDTSVLLIPQLPLPKSLVRRQIVVSSAQCYNYAVYGSVFKSPAMCSGPVVSDLYKSCSVSSQTTYGGVVLSGVTANQCSVAGSTATVYTKGYATVNAFIGTINLACLFFSSFVRY